MKYELPKLNYAYDALEPFIDASTMEIHHSKHHQAYTDNFNKALAEHPDLGEMPVEELLAKVNELSIDQKDKNALRNHGGGYYNHKLFWELMDPSNKKDEALIKDISVIGIDIDKMAVDGATQNLSWNKFPSNKYKLFSRDSRKFSLNQNINAIVTEPDLGNLLRKIPSNDETRQTLTDFENLMIDVLSNYKNNLLNRVVFSAPFIKTKSNKYAGCDINKILQQTGLKLVEGFPIADYRSQQIVGRQIFVLEK